MAKNTLPPLVHVPIELSQAIESTLWDAAQYMASYHKQPHLKKFPNADAQMARLNQEYRAESAKVHSIEKTSVAGKLISWAADRAENRRDMMTALVGVMNEHLQFHRASDTLILLRGIRDRAHRAASDLGRIIRLANTPAPAPAAKPASKRPRRKSEPSATTSHG